MAVHLLLSSPPKPPPQNPNPNCDPKFCPKSCQRSKSRREVSIQALTISMVSLTPWFFVPTALLASLETSAPPRKPSLSGISNTKSWNQFFGDGFSIRVPPLFEDIMEPEDYKSGLSYYGDKAKPKTFAARFASPDRGITGSIFLDFFIKIATAEVEKQIYGMYRLLLFGSLNSKPIVDQDFKTVEWTCAGHWLVNAVPVSIDDSASTASTLHQYGLVVGTSGTYQLMQAIPTVLESLQ